MRQIFAGVVGLFLFAGPAVAGPIAVTFTGVVSEVQDYWGRSTAGIGVGTPFTARVVYETAATPAPFGEGIVTYQHLSTSLTVGAKAMPTAPPSPHPSDGDEIIVFNDYVDEMPTTDTGTPDALHVMGRLSTSHFTWGSFFHITLWDDTGTAFTGLDLPTQLDLGRFQRATFSLRFGPTDEPLSGAAQVYGDITAVSVVPAPEPGSFTLLTCGAVGLLAARRRRPVLRSNGEGE